MRRFSALALTALLGLLLSACGSTAPATSTDATSATGATTTTGSDATTNTTATTTGAMTDTTATTTGAMTDATSAATTDANATPMMEATATTTGAMTSATTVATTDTMTSTTGITTTGDAATDDLIAAATANGNLTTLVTALQASGLEDQLKGVGPYTLFAPTDTAFANLPSGVLTALLADPTLLGSILSYHVAQGELKAADIAKVTSIPTLHGQPITVTMNGSMVMLNGSTMLTTTDITTTNGVIHVIDKVLIPSDVTLPTGS